jgi:hypothetical protein
MDVVTARDHPGDRPSPPVVIEHDPQETDRQERDHNTTAISIARSGPQLAAMIDAVSEELGDARCKATNRTRAGRILDGVSDEYAAQIAGAALRRVRTVLQVQGGVKNRMAYYFGVLDDMARQAQTPSRRDSLAGRYAHLVQR